MADSGKPEESLSKDISKGCLNRYRHLISHKNLISTFSIKRGLTRKKSETNEGFKESFCGLKTNQQIGQISLQKSISNDVTDLLKRGTLLTSKRILFHNESYNFISIEY
ncbi:MAG: hypothetical protein HEP71_25340 [Roseivirga sp.]|nr:hypothetical protein [Roseivirga sp.]